MDERLERTQMLLGKEALLRLKNAHVAVFGVGGVGGYVAEALARSGVGQITLVDKDVVSISNINRQIIALTGTVGKEKTLVMKERICDINPEIRVHAKNVFFLPETANQFDFHDYDYVVDAVDTVSAKIEIIMKAKEAQVPVISSMGAGNKLDPTKFAVADIYKTSMCPLAKVMRHEMKKRGVRKLKVVYSTEAPIKTGMRTPGSIAFVPSVAGLILAGEVIKDLITV